MKKVKTKVTLKKAETLGFFDPATNTVYISGCSKWSARTAKVKEGHHVAVKLSIAHLKHLMYLYEQRSEAQNARRIKTDFI